MKTNKPAPAKGYRELLGIPDASAMAANGHAPLKANKPHPTQAATGAAPHPTAPGRDTTGKMLPAPSAGEKCPACNGSGRKG